MLIEAALGAAGALVLEAGLGLEDVLGLEEGGVELQGLIRIEERLVQ